MCLTQTSFLVVLQVRCPGVPIPYSHTILTKSGEETFLATTSDTGRVRHYHIRLTSRVVPIGSSSIVGGKVVRKVF